MNRTIPKLKEDKVISIVKGKISMTYEQYKLAAKIIKYYVKQDIKK